ERQPEAAMNVLIYDAPMSVCHLVKSLLLTQKHRAAISTEPEDAILKLETGLFDILVFGPSGAPAELAEHVELEYPNLPVVLAGVPVQVPCAGQVAAVIPSPISAQRLVNAFIRIDRWRQQRLRQLPCQLAGQDGVSVLCRLADLSMDSLVIAGEADEFLRHFGSSMPRRIEAMVGTTLLAGEVTREETDCVQRLRRVAVKIEGDAARGLLISMLK
ncbi:MAG TPA: hypothetical protein VM222_00420, partial [Planctomycetota bacterium]|nr:hypothetical protein [Planctomycetota bacterium]